MTASQVAPAGNYRVEPHPTVNGWWCVVDPAGRVTVKRTRRAFFADRDAADKFVDCCNRRRLPRRK